MYTVKEKISPASRMLLLSAILISSLFSATSARAEVFYGVTVNGIFSVNSVTGGPATQVATFTPAIASGVTLATRPSDGMLFYLNSIAANPNLWRWDPSTPAVPPVLVGTPGATTTGIIRLGFDMAGNLFASNNVAPFNLWTLSPDTGAILNVVPLSGTIPVGGGDMCLHPTTGVLYLVANQNLYTMTSSG
ncbi:MAG: hypothetical protein ABL860_05245, partial [Candidatus Nitrotoga sp.]